MFGSFYEEMEYIFIVKILIFINFSLTKIVDMMSQGEILEQKTKENSFAIHLMTPYQTGKFAKYARKGAHLKKKCAPTHLLFRT